MVCHVRAGRVIAARLPEGRWRSANQHAHEYTVAPVLAQAEFCAACHQFNFPDAASADPRAPLARFRYAPLVMPAKAAS